MDTGRAFFKIQIDRYIFALLLEIPKPTSIYIRKRCDYFELLHS